MLARVLVFLGPQVLAVLEAMGGTLKADDAELAYKQEKKAKSARSAADLVRVTAMFSATMPPAVEKMAKKYLRHPAIVQVCKCVLVFVRVCVCVFAWCVHFSSEHRPG